MNSLLIQVPPKVRHPQPTSILPMKARDPTPNQEPRRRTISLQPYINALLRVALKPSNQPRNQPHKLVARRDLGLDVRVGRALVVKHSRVLERSPRSPNVVDAALAGVARRLAKARRSRLGGRARRREARVQHSVVDVRAVAGHRPAQLLGRQQRGHVRGDEGVELRLQALGGGGEGALLGCARRDELCCLGGRRLALLRTLREERRVARGELGLKELGVGEGGAFVRDLLRE